MKKVEKGKEEIADLNFKRNEHERKKVRIVEIIIVSIPVVLTDLVEFFLPGVGMLIGIPIQGFIILWAFLRRLHGRIEIKLIAGLVTDKVLGGVLPIMTIVLWVLIWLNNRFSKKQIKKITDILTGHIT